MQQLGCESHSVTCVSCYVHVYGNKVIIIIIIIIIIRVPVFPDMTMNISPVLHLVIDGGFVPRTFRSLKQLKKPIELRQPRKLSSEDVIF